MKNLALLVDSYEYVNSEIYQHQLHSILQKNYNCFYISDFNSKESYDKINKSDIVLSCLKIRSFSNTKKLIEIKNLLQNRKLIIQDFDPWVCLDDTSQYKGLYLKINNEIENSLIFTTSQYWSNYLNSRNVNSVFSQIGMLDEYCEYSKTWNERSRYIEFKGSTYPVREKNFEKIKSLNIPLIWNKDIIKPYKNFLEYLSSLKIWIQDESEKISVDGESHCRNWLWPKAIEILSRGCFLIRDYHEESIYYNIHELPTAFLYHDINEIPNIIETINSMSDKEKLERMIETINNIKQRDVYTNLSNKLPYWYYE